MYDDWHQGGWGPGSWILMVVMMLAFWSTLVAVAMYVVRNVGVGRSDSHRRDDALGILDERLARGEIDAEDYTARKELLRRT